MEFFSGIENPRGRAQYLGGMSVNNVFDFIWQTPIRIIFFYLTPFIWMISTVGDLVGLLDALLLFFLIYYSIKSLYVTAGKQKNLIKGLLIAFIVISIVFSWGTSNYGTAIRHRQKMLVLLIPLASLSLKYSIFVKILNRISIK